MEKELVCGVIISISLLISSTNFSYSEESFDYKLLTLSIRDSKNSPISNTFCQVIDDKDNVKDYGFTNKWGNVLFSWNDNREEMIIHVACLHEKNAIENLVFVTSNNLNYFVWNVKINPENLT